MEKEKERWKAIKRYEGLYSISNYGRVLSRARVINTSTYSTRIPNKILVGGKIDGYKSVSLSKDNKQKTFLVHRLVCLAFLPNPDNKDLVNHKDSNRDNNNLSNLEWVTQRENTCHSEQKFVNSSIYRGVSYHKKTKSYVSQIQVNGKNIHLGRYKLEIDAHKARVKYEQDNNIQNKYLCPVP